MKDIFVYYMNSNIQWWFQKSCYVLCIFYSRI